MTELQQYKRFYELFREVSQMVHSHGELTDVLNMVISRMVDGIDALGGVLCVIDRATKSFEPRASYKVPGSYLALRPLAGERLLHWPEADNKIHVINNIFESDRVESLPGPKISFGPEQYVEMTGNPHAIASIITLLKDS